MWVPAIVHDGVELYSVQWSEPTVHGQNPHGIEFSSFEDAAKTIKPCKLSLMTNADLDSIPLPEKPDPALVAKYQILELSMMLQRVKSIFKRDGTSIYFCGRIRSDGTKK